MNMPQFAYAVFRLGEDYGLGEKISAIYLNLTAAVTAKDVWRVQVFAVNEDKYSAHWAAESNFVALIMRTPVELRTQIIASRESGVVAPQERREDPPADLCV